MHTSLYARKPDHRTDSQKSLSTLAPSACLSTEDNNLVIETGLGICYHREAEIGIKDHTRTHPRKDERTKCTLNTSQGTAKNSVLPSLKNNWLHNWARDAGSCAGVECAIYPGSVSRNEVPATPEFTKTLGSVHKERTSVSGL